MEYIINVAQFEKMNDNKIIGTPELIDTEITFKGINNILVCDNNISLKQVTLNFEGNNSIVYLGSNPGKNFNLTVYHNSTIYLGKNSDIYENVSIQSSEKQNIIIGDDCIIGKNVNIETCEDYPIYDSQNKTRINIPQSIYIGDHVWIRNNAHISKGVQIGSGSIIDKHTIILPNMKIVSNVLVSRNPAKIIKKDIFFTKNIINHESFEDTKNYKSTIFIYEYKNGETLNLNNIEKILRDLDTSKRFEFIRKLFIENKRKERFTIR